MVEAKGKVIKIFYCYAPEDRALLDQLEKHLSPMRRLKQITGWFNRDILAGTDWAREIETQINAASLILLLISPDFIHSDYCYGVEMQRALERHENGTAHVIPIILRPVLWEDTPIGRIQVLPTTGIPITKWSDRDEALVDVVRGISKVVKMLLSKETLSQQETSLLERLGRPAQPQSITHNQKPPVMEQTSLPSKITLPLEEHFTGPMTGSVLVRRYRLEGLVKQGQVCAIYQGTDVVLQRSVSIKAVPASNITAYRAAIKLTAHFSHPNVVGIYDLVVEPETLFIVQEYIEGFTFSILLQRQLSPYEVVEIGMQICQALIYADNTGSKVCHGDLTPSAIMCDHLGLVRVNNFALPGDFSYFQKWCTMGSDNIIFSDTDLPYGQQSKGRRSDDTRAVGLLLYQLLAGRTPGSTVVEPHHDGRLHFQRNVPAYLCEIVARAVFRNHPGNINTSENLLAALDKLLDEFEAQESK